MNSLTKFLMSMTDDGLPCFEPIIPDGRVHYFWTKGDSKSTAQGFYSLTLEPEVKAVYGHVGRGWVTAWTGV
jgi:hypothetical protein